MPSWLAGIVVLFVGAGGCFFTEVVNEAPVSGIRTLKDGPHFIGETLSFNATKTVDDVVSNLSCEWRAFTCQDSAGTNCTPIGEPEFYGITGEFEVLVESHETIKIQLQVTDELGATRLQPDIVTIDVNNRAPSIDLEVTGHKEPQTDLFVLYRAIDLVIAPGVGGGDDVTLDPDGDEVTFSWSYLAPPGSQESARSFDEVGEDGYRLVPDVSGQWTVTLTADDGHGGTDEITKTIPVGVDSPPCLQSLDPVADTSGFYLVESADGARSFSVLSVVDALDPFPMSPGADEVFGTSTFRWFLKEPGAASFTWIAGHVAESYAVDPLNYEPGDLLELRVEVQDRVQGAERELTCADDARACELNAGSQCFQRLTWGVQIQ
ncbi:MAG: hypothetical protein GY811_31275 [Myxococcales bacterium]|nr:hypothetical protein [Myxococcales bacterium]